jgi:hypothetical protein
MEVKALSLKLRGDSLPARTERTRTSQSEAGNRAQSDGRYGLALALIGSVQGENRT